jgi:hypothetical protein
MLLPGIVSFGVLTEYFALALKDADEKKTILPVF